MGKRNELFEWIFDQCDGRQYRSAHLSKFLETHPDWTENDLSSISDFLAGEGLVEQKDDGGLMVWLTHEGVKAGSSPEDAIDGAAVSPAIHNTQNIFHAPVGSVQQGNQNVANVAQKFGPDASDVANMLRELREQIIPEHVEAGNDYIDAIEDELKKEIPKESRLRLFLQGVAGVATEAGKAIIVEIGKKLLSGEIQQ